MRVAALAAGWLYVAAIVWLSLTPSPPQLDIAHSDKLEHFLAYAVLMFWFAATYRSTKARLAYGAGWIALGVALEFAQAATDYRSFELADMAANTLGVLAGAAAARILTGAAGAAGAGLR
jgi:VanZ family protein